MRPLLLIAALSTPAIAADYDHFAPTPKRATNWTCLEIVVGEPAEAWAGTSDCAPCNRICRDVKGYTTFAGSRWLVAVGSHKMPDGRAAHIAIVKSMPGEATPFFQRVESGKVTKRLNGYDGKVQSVIDLYPGTLETVNVRVNRVSVSEAPVTVARSQSVPVYAVRGGGSDITFHRNIDGKSIGSFADWEIRDHLVQHGYGRDYLDSLNRQQLIALHDSDHDSGRVGQFGQINWGPYPVAPVTTSNYRPVYQSNYQTTPSYSYCSQGFQILGQPIMGSYSYGSTCPGGICRP